MCFCDQYSMRVARRHDILRRGQFHRLAGHAPAPPGRCRRSRGRPRPGRWRCRCARGHRPRGGRFRCCRCRPARRWPAARAWPRPAWACGGSSGLAPGGGGLLAVMRNQPVGRDGHVAAHRARIVMRGYGLRRLVPVDAAQRGDGDRAAMRQVDRLRARPPAGASRRRRAAPATRRPPNGISSRHSAPAWPDRGTARCRPCRPA